MSEQNYIKQNRIRLVEYSQVLLVCLGLFRNCFLVISGSQAGVCALDNIVLAHTSDILVQMLQFLEELLNTCNRKLDLCSYNSSGALKIDFEPKELIQCLKPP